LRNLLKDISEYRANPTINLHADQLSDFLLGVCNLAREQSLGIPERI